MSANNIIHKARIMTLYRRCLRFAESMFPKQSQLLMHSCNEIRKEFEKFESLSDPGDIERAVSLGEERYARLIDEYPNQYIHPLNPKGSKWMRNVQPVSGRNRAHRLLDLVMAYDDGKFKGNLKVPTILDDMWLLVDEKHQDKYDEYPFDVTKGPPNDH